MALYNLGLIPPADAVRESADAHMKAKFVAQSNTDYAVKQVRNIIISEEDAELELMEDGDIWIKI